ncbi:hypothetical protein [Isoalcanivorax indicus]|uniref:hypothetical protein n=1 Tax=Isoalcanivorax indicus TaxID=2202653 RepID=UPI000DBAC91B|nr:hypothetical protein [Isoalcanivorax indicus]
MHTIILLVFIAATGFAVVYVHRMLPRLVPRQGPVWLARGVLTLVGILFGAAMVWRFAQLEVTGGAVPAVLVFASAFGVTHVPAAFILFLKQLARRQAS